MLRRFLRPARFLVPLLLTACAHGQIGPLPLVPDPDQSAVVYIIRSRILLCGGERAFVRLDGESPFVSLRGAEHAGFRVPAGRHTISVEFELGFGWPQEFEFLPNTTHYLLIQPSMQPFPVPGFLMDCWGQLLPLTDQGGRHRVKTSRAILPPLADVTEAPAPAQNMEKSP